MECSLQGSELEELTWEGFRMDLRSELGLDQTVDWQGKWDGHSRWTPRPRARTKWDIAECTQRSRVWVSHCLSTDPPTVGR